MHDFLHGNIMHSTFHNYANMRTKHCFAKNQICVKFMRINNSETYYCKFLDLFLYNNNVQQNFGFITKKIKYTHMVHFVQCHSGNVKGRLLPKICNIYINKNKFFSILHKYMLYMYIQK